LSSSRSFAANKLFADNGGDCDEPDKPCWSVKGKWHFAPGAAGARYDDLVIDFSGVAPPAEDADAPEEAASATEPAPPPASTAKKIAQSALCFRRQALPADRRVQSRSRYLSPNREDLPRQPAGGAS